jgi:hypothetical protein
MRSPCPLSPMVWRRRAAPHHAHHAGAYNQKSACVYAGGFTPEHDVVGASSPLPGEDEGTCTPLLQETSPSCTRCNTTWWCYKRGHR